MKVEFHDISLHLITKDLLEELRRIRNRASELGFMINSRLLTQEDQVLWFNSIDSNLNYFFIIESKEKKIGVCHISSLSEAFNNAECGLYLIDESYISTQVSVLSSLIVLFLAFEILNLTELKAKVLVLNNKAIQYNESLGFEFAERLNEQVILMKIGFEQYKNISKVLFNKLVKQSPIAISTESLDSNSRLFQAIELFQINTDSSKVELKIH